MDGKKYFYARWRLWVIRGSLLTAALAVAITTLWSLVEITPWYQHQLQAEVLKRIESATGLSARAASCHVDGREFASLRNLVLIDPETREAVITCRLIFLRQSLPARIAAEAHGVHIDRDRLARSIDRWRTALWKREVRKSVQAVHLIAKEVHWRSGAERASCDALTLDWKLDHEEASATARMVGKQGDSPLTVSVTRFRTSGLWYAAADTGDVAVPLRGWTDVVPMAQLFGRQATYRGQFEWERDSAEWTCRMSGTVEHIDLNQLVTQHLPHKLSGTATLTLSSVAVADGRWVSGDAALVSTHGKVSRGLLEGVARELGWRTSRVLSSLPAVLAFDELSVQLRVAQGRLAVTGGLLDGERNLALRGPSIEVVGTSRVLDWSAVSRILLPGHSWARLNQTQTAADRLSAWFESARVPVKLRESGGSQQEVVGD